MGECILAGRPQGGGIKYGTYAGNGKEVQKISLGVTPKWVLSFNQDGATCFQSGTGKVYIGGLALPEVQTGATKIVDGGFEAYYDNVSRSPIWGNNSETKYNYIYGT